MGQNILIFLVFTICPYECIIRAHGREVRFQYDEEVHHFCIRIHSCRIRPQSMIQRQLRISQFMHTTSQLVHTTTKYDSNYEFENDQEMSFIMTTSENDQETVLQRRLINSTMDYFWH